MRPSPAESACSDNQRTVIQGVTQTTQKALATAIDHHRAGKLNAAATGYRKVLKRQPDNAAALHLLGLINLQTGNLEPAAKLLRKAVAADASVAGHHRDLGHALRGLRRLDEAAEAYRHAAERDPGDPTTWLGLGAVLHAGRQLTEALDAFDALLERDPRHAVGLANRAGVLRDLGRFEDAEADCRAALAVDPEQRVAHGNLAVVLADTGRIEDAVATYRRVLELDPENAIAHNNLGNALQEMGRVGDAVESYRRALAILPKQAPFEVNLANALQTLGRLDEADAAYRRAIQVMPDLATAHSNRLFGLNYHPDLTAEEIFAAYRDWDDRFAKPLRPAAAAFPGDADPARRLRIGYVSPDFRWHAARFFIEPLLRAHDRDAVEVFAYAEVRAADEVTGRMRGAVDHWCDTVGLTDDAMAERIRDDRIDVLVDLAGHTRGNRLMVFARKPAPVQVSWLGYAYTTGLSAIDYFLADQVFVPDGADHLFSETVYRLPNAAFCYRPPEEAPAVGPLPALQNGHLTFGYFSRAIRINHRVVDVWSRLLKAVPDARLMLNGRPYLDGSVQRTLRDAFAAEDVDPERLILTFESPPWESYGRIDIALDPFPHNAGTTTFESLWMGVPVLTLAGRPSVGRFGASVLTPVGLEDWIAADEDTYVSRAVQAANDLAGLARLRGEIRDRFQASALRDETGFARDIEAAYRTMWRRHCGAAAA